VIRQLAESILIQKHTRQ